jgi:hypothetical protein
VSAIDYDDLVNRYVLRDYRYAHSYEHLATCPDTVVTDADLRNGTYGCETGCEYARLDAALTCPHGVTAEHRYGTFGDVGVILTEIDELVAKGEL